MNDATSPPVNRLPPLGADRPVWRDGLSVAPGLAQDGALAMDTSDDEEGARESSVAAAGSAFLGLGAKKRQSSRALRAPQASVDFAANAAAAAAVGKKRQSSGALRAPAPQGAQASAEAVGEVPHRVDFQPITFHHADVGDSKLPDADDASVGRLRATAAPTLRRKVGELIESQRHARVVNVGYNVSLAAAHKQGSFTTKSSLTRAGSSAGSTSTPCSRRLQGEHHAA